MRLLIVEDNPDLAELIGTRLREAGFVNDIVSTAEDARLLVEAGHHAALLLDLGLPDQDGIALLRSLRAAGHFLPVLVLTARSSIADRVAGLNAGADDYLPKPFAAEELVARVAALLRRATGRTAWKSRAAACATMSRPRPSASMNTPSSWPRARSSCWIS